MAPRNSSCRPATKASTSRVRMDANSRSYRPWRRRGARGRQRQRGGPHPAVARQHGAGRAGAQPSTTGHCDRGHRPKQSAARFLACMFLKFHCGTLVVKLLALSLHLKLQPLFRHFPVSSRVEQRPQHRFVRLCSVEREAWSKPLNDGQNSITPAQMIKVNGFDS